MRRTAALVAGLLAVPLLVPQAAAGSYRVTMKTYAFHSAALTVSVGDTVTWTNQDQAGHNVVTTSGPATLHSPMLARGRSWSYTFRVAGTYAYYCSVHPDMRARIVVRPAAAPGSTAPAPASGGKVTGKRKRGTSASPSRAAGQGTGMPTLTPSAQPSIAPAAVQPAAAESKTVNPLLVLTGIVSAVAVFCLLLLTSAAGPRRDPEP
jgi:amicyanin